MKIERRVLLLAIVYAVLTGTTAYAAIVASRALSGTVTIQSATPGLSVTAYPSCSTDLASVSFPSIGPNVDDESTFILCVKNTGNVDFWIVSSSSVTFSGLPPGVISNWAAYGPQTTTLLLNPGDTDPLVLFLTNNGTAPAGTITLTLTFTGYSTSTG